jgi:Mg-chelatase subunit ChlD
MFVEGGSSAVLDAVRFSLDYLSANVKKEGSRPAALLLISDGDDTASTAKVDTVVTAASQAGIRIVVVGLSDEKVNTKLLDRLAKGSGGKAFYPKTPKELTESVQLIASALRGK